MIKTLKLQVSEIADKLKLRPIPKDWSGCDVVWPILEKIKDDGAVVIVKLDGGRTNIDDNGSYTIVISGHPLGDAPIRIDSFSFEEAIATAIVNYSNRFWKT